MGTLFDEFTRLFELAEADKAKIYGFTERDALLIIDMQNDFVPHDAVTNPDGGNFGVAEGHDIIQPIVDLIDAAVQAKATVCATRDYHPHDHCSFLPKGPFPAHCVQGTAGAKLVTPIAEALSAGLRVLQSDAKVFIAFKAMHEDTDSFGALPYYDGGKGRIVRCGVCEEEPNPNNPNPTPMGCSAAPWTGSLVLKCSALRRALSANDGDAIDMDAPPDVLSTTEDGVQRGMQNLQDALKGCKRLFVCGLALDFCVLDTCLNARGAGFDEVYMIYDAARAAHIPGIGTHGSGFLSDPKEVLQKMLDAKVGVASTADLLSTSTATLRAHLDERAAPFANGDPRERSGSIIADVPLIIKPFPHGLAPLPLTTANVNVYRDGGGLVGGLTSLAPSPASSNEGTTMRLELVGVLKPLADAKISNELPCAPMTTVPRHWPGAPPMAQYMCFVSPMKGILELSRTSASRLSFLAISASAELSFAAYGGFLFFNRDEMVVGAQSISGSGRRTRLEFGEPHKWRHEFTTSLRNSNRLQPVTLPHLLREGATHFCWLNPLEGFQVGASSKIATKTGGFLYMRAHDPPLYFELLQPPPLHVAYVTDIEGNWTYFSSWLKRTDCLTKLGTHLDGSLDLELKEGWQIVYGGDAVDKGGSIGGSIRVVKTLVRLYEKYPTRVTLLLGNRDINKMRIPSELGDASQLTDDMLPKVPGPYWVEEKKRVSPLMYLEKLAAAANAEAEKKEKEKEKEGEGGGGSESGSERSSGSTRRWSKGNDNNSSKVTAQQLNTPFNRLKWLLYETMGAAGEEERRRAELAHIGGLEPSMISDEDVVNSFVDSTKPGGWMTRLLQCGQLAAIIGDALYVHGGVISDCYADGQQDCLGMIPGRPYTERLDDLGEWVDQLNWFHQAQLKEWLQQPKWADSRRGASKVDSLKGHDQRGGQALMDYCVAPNCYPSVVLGRHLTPKSMGRDMPAHVLQTLLNNNIHRLVVGHTPHGNCPSVVTQPTPPGSKVPRFEVLMVDTSYSDMDQKDNRGRAVSTVELMANGKVVVRGVLQNMASIQYSLASLKSRSSAKPEAPSDEAKELASPTASEPPTPRAVSGGKDGLESLVGELEPAFYQGVEVQERRFVKARLSETGDFLMCYVSGFRYNYSLLSPDEARELFGLATHDEQLELKFSSSGGEESTNARQAREDKIDALVELFDKIDVNGDGHLTPSELSDALEKEPSILKVLMSGDPDGEDMLSGKDAKMNAAHLLKRMDASQDGKIQFGEFLKAFSIGLTPDIRLRLTLHKRKKAEANERQTMLRMRRSSMQQSLTRLSLSSTRNSMAMAVAGFPSVPGSAAAAGAGMAQMGGGGGGGGGGGAFPTVPEGAFEATGLEDGGGDGGAGLREWQAKAADAIRRQHEAEAALMAFWKKRCEEAEQKEEEARKELHRAKADKAISGSPAAGKPRSASPLSFLWRGGGGGKKGGGSRSGSPAPSRGASESKLQAQLSGRL